MNLIKEERGFTLIESVLAFFISTLLIICVSITLQYTIKVSQRLINLNSNFENAALAMNFIKMQINSSNGYTLNKYDDILILYNNNTKSNFKFVKRLNQIIYANNLLAENIDNLTIELKNSNLIIKIEITENETHKLILIGEVNVKYKTHY